MTHDEAAVLHIVIVAVTGLCVIAAFLFLHHRWLARFLQRLQGHHADVWERFARPAIPGKETEFRMFGAGLTWFQLGGGYRKLEDAELTHWGDRLRWLLIGANVLAISALVYEQWR